MTQGMDFNWFEGMSTYADISQADNPVMRPDDMLVWRKGGFWNMPCCRDGEHCWSSAAGFLRRNAHTRETWEEFLVMPTSPGALAPIYLCRTDGCLKCGLGRLQTFDCPSSHDECDVGNPLSVICCPGVFWTDAGFYISTRVLRPLAEVTIRQVKMQSPHIVFSVLTMGQAWTLDRLAPYVSPVTLALWGKTGFPRNRDIQDIAVDLSELDAALMDLGDLESHDWGAVGGVSNIYMKPSEGHFVAHEHEGVRWISAPKAREFMGGEGRDAQVAHVVREFASGNWGEVERSDRASNSQARLRKRGPMLGSYRIGETEIWVYHRLPSTSPPTVMLPEEY